MLTKKQKQLLDYIKFYLNDRGYSPSFQEMMEDMNLKSKSGVFRLVNSLEERGFIRRLPNRARAIEIVNMPVNPDNKTQIQTEDGVWVFFRNPLDISNSKV